LRSGSATRQAGTALSLDFWTPIGAQLSRAVRASLSRFAPSISAVGAQLGFPNR
jgi:hypothetical protein